MVLLIPVGYERFQERNGNFIRILRLNVGLSGKIAVVTRDSRVIGKTISLAQARSGANIVIAVRSEEESPSLPRTIYNTSE